jgi:hemoglobin
MRTLTAALVLSAAALLVAGPGCKHDDEHMDHKMSSSMTKDSMPAKSLYDRLGGEPAVTAVVHDFVGRAASDPKVNFTRKGTAMEWNATPENVAKLERRLVQFIASNTGGPKMYEGRPMKPVHAGMKITSAEFDAAAGDLIASLDKFKVPQREKDELVAVVASTKGDIVEMK